MSQVLQIHLKEVQRYPTLTPKEEKQLALKVMLGNEQARERLITGNMRFVISKALEYADQGIPIEDLIQEGYVGLCKAVDKYDPLKGYKFITFASWWIWQSIIQFLTNNSSMVRIPANKVSDISKVRRMEDQLHNELGRMPNLEELEAALPNINVEKVMPWVHINFSKKPTIDSEVGAVNDQDEIDILAKASGIPFPQPDDELLAKSTIQELQTALDKLSKREQSILRLYYGMDDMATLTLEEIGDLFGLTRERIRQIKNSALLKLAKMGTLKDAL